MGADFLCQIVEIIPESEIQASGKIEKLESISGKRLITEVEIEAFCDERGYSVDDPDERATAVNEIEEACEYVSNSIKNGSRESETVKLYDRQYLVTGGMSWGDDPSELFEHISRLYAAGMLEKVGLRFPPAETPDNPEVKKGELPVHLSRKELALVVSCLRAVKTGLAGENLKSRTAKLDALLDKFIRSHFNVALGSKPRSQAASRPLSGIA